MGYNPTASERGCRVTVNHAWQPGVEEGLQFTEDFVGLVDLLEHALSSDVVLGDIGVIFACEAAERLLDFSVVRVRAHAENSVIVFKLNGHDRLRTRGPA